MFSAILNFLLYGSTVFEIVHGFSIIIKVPTNNKTKHFENTYRYIRDLNPELLDEELRCYQLTLRMPAYTLSFQLKKLRSVGSSSLSTLKAESGSFSPTTYISVAER